MRPNFSLHCRVPWRLRRKLAPIVETDCASDMMQHDAAIAAGAHAHPAVKQQRTLNMCGVQQGLR